MKLLLIGPVPPELGSRNPGGVAHHTWSLAKVLASRGHEVDLLVLGRYFRSTRLVSGVKLIGIALRPLRIIYAIWLWFSHLIKFRLNGTVKDHLYLVYTIFRLSCIAPKANYDVIHVHGLNNQASAACRIIGIDVPVIVTMHSYHDIIFRPSTNEQTKRIAAWNRLISELQAIIHVSNADRERGLSLRIKWQCPDYVIHNGMAIPKQKDLLKSSNGVCFVGSLEDRKGIRELLEAWKEIPVKKTGPLYIAGNGQLRELISAQVEKMQQVKLLGYLSTGAARDLMNFSWALVVPSRSESFGLVYLESLLVGTPVVGYFRAINEFRDELHCTAEEKEFLIPVNIEETSPAVLAQAIQRAVKAKQKDSNGQIAATLAEKVSEHFGWNRTIQKIEAVYSSIIARSTFIT